MAIREGRWDCPVCGRVGNRGSARHCPSCGSPRGAAVSFYLPENEPEVTAAEALRRARAGPDWTCTYCGSDNVADADFCTNCGGPKDGAASRPVIEHPVALPPPPVSPPQAVASSQPVTALQESESRSEPKRRGKWRRFGCLGVLALIALVAFLGRPKAASLTVEDLSWRRVIEVEVAKTLTAEGWQHEVPAGARVLSMDRAIFEQKKIRTGTETRSRRVSERVQVGTESVKVGVRDLGNGYFEDMYEQRPVHETRYRDETYEEPVYRTEPVYRNRVRYEYERWEKQKVSELQGFGGSPTWPAVPQTAFQRPGSRRESYKVHFVDAEGEKYLYEVKNFSQWQRFERGQRYHAKVQAGKVRSLEPFRVER